MACDTVAVDTARIDHAVDLLYRYDPEHHNPRDYVLTIAEAVVGHPLAISDSRTWTDDGEQIVGARGSLPTPLTEELIRLAIFPPPAEMIARLLRIIPRRRNPARRWWSFWRPRFVAEQQGVEVYFGDGVE